MTDATLPCADRSLLAAVRVRRFTQLTVASLVVGGIGGASEQWLEPAVLLLWMPTFVLWVVSDLRVRGVAGMGFVLQLLLSLFPVWGLLLYLLWSRRIAGVAQWLLFVAAMWIPAMLAGGLSYGIAQLARGERW